MSEPGDEGEKSPSAPRKLGGVKALLAQLEEKSRESGSVPTPTRKTPIPSPSGSFKTRNPSNPGLKAPSPLPADEPNGGRASMEQNERPNMPVVAASDSVVPSSSDPKASTGDEGKSTDGTNGMQGDSATRPPSDSGRSSATPAQGSRRSSAGGHGMPPLHPQSQAPPQVVPLRQPAQNSAQPSRQNSSPPSRSETPSNTENLTPNALFHASDLAQLGPQGRPPAATPDVTPITTKASIRTPPQATQQDVVFSDYPASPPVHAHDAEGYWRADVESRWKMEADKHKQAMHDFAKVAKQAKADAERAREALGASERRLQMEEAERRREQDGHKRELDSLQAELHGYRTLRESSLGPGDSIEQHARLRELETTVSELTAQHEAMLEELRVRDEAISEFHLQTQNRQASEVELRADVEQQLIHLQSAYLNEQAGRKVAEAERAELWEKREGASDKTALQEKEKQILALRAELMQIKAQAPPARPPPASVVESDLRRVQTILDMKSEEMKRLKKQLAATSQERDELKLAAVGSLSQPPPAHEGGHQTSSLTEEKDKTISDLLVLQDDMVKELHSMREDLSALAQRNSVVEEEREHLSQQLNALYTQQSSPGTVPQSAPKEKLWQLEEAERKERYMEEARAHMEEALGKARSEMVAAMQAAQEERQEVLREAEAERTQLLARLDSARGLEAEVQALKLELEQQGPPKEDPRAAEELRRQLEEARQDKERLARMLSEQGKGFIQMQKQQDAARLADLRDQVLSLDRKGDPTDAVKALQKVVVDQKLEEEGRKRDAARPLSRPDSPGGLLRAAPSPSSQSQLRSVVPLRASMPESTLREALFADTTSEVKVPDTLPPATSLATSSRQLSSSVDAMYLSAEQGVRRGDAPARLVRSTSPGSSFSGGESPLQRVIEPLPEIAEDILNYQPPSTRLQREKLASPPPPDVAVVRASPVRPGVSPSGGLRAVPAPSPSTPAAARDMSPAPKGMSPSEYVASRAKRGMGAGVVHNSTAVVRQASPASTMMVGSRGSPSVSGLLDASRVPEDEDKFSPERLERFAKLQDQLMNQDSNHRGELPEEWEMGLGQVQLTPDGNIMPVVRAPTMLPGIEEENQNDPRRWSRESAESGDESAPNQAHAASDQVVVDDDDDDEDYEVEEYDPVREESGHVTLPPPKNAISRTRMGV